MCTLAVELFLFFALLLLSRTFRVALGLLTVVVLVLLAVISARADTPKVPKELQDIWCAWRPRVGGVPEGRCLRFGPSSMTWEGYATTLLSLQQGPRHTYRVTFRFADGRKFGLRLVKRRNYLLASRFPREPLYGEVEPVRHNRGNPYAQFYSEGPASLEMPRALVGSWCNADNRPTWFQPDDGTYSDCNDLVISRTGFVTHDGDDCALQDYRARPTRLTIVYHMTFSCRAAGSSKRRHHSRYEVTMQSFDKGLLRWRRPRSSGGVFLWGPTWTKARHSILTGPKTRTASPRPSPAQGRPSRVPGLNWPRCPEKPVPDRF
jgi:hypothetical protein